MHEEEEEDEEAADVSSGGLRQEQKPPVKIKLQFGCLLPCVAAENGEHEVRTIRTWDTSGS